MLRSVHHAISYFMLMLKTNAASLPHINKDRHGQGLVEYALILVLVAIVVIAALSILGPEINDVFVKIACKFDPDITVINRATGGTITCQEIWGETPPEP